MHAESCRIMTVNVERERGVPKVLSTWPSWRRANGESLRPEERSGIGPVMKPWYEVLRIRPNTKCSGRVC